MVAAGLLAGGLFANRVALLDPPGLAVRLRTFLTTHVAETSARPVLPELGEPRFELPAARILEAVPAAMAALGWDWRWEPESGTHHAVVTTALWRFRDDLVVRVVDEGGSSSRLEVRSASRVGRGDLGANLRHVLDFQRELRHQLEAPAR
jgi:hypothetical protein